MLVYREQRERACPAQMLTGVRRQLSMLAPAHAGAHDRTVRLLIELGVLEAGVADAIHPEADGVHPLTARLRASAVTLGHLVWHSWRGSLREQAPWLARAGAAIDAVADAALPAEIDSKVPEGFAHYGLYPETYLTAAVRVARSLCPERAICLGIRSIGTSLSAIVAAALEELGCEVFSFTVRPRGHPFDRRLRLDESLASLVRADANALFLLVDEGPGVSGSSLAGAARTLEDLGVREDHIVLMPSWRSDGRSLRSSDARARWQRHPQFTSTFDEVWLASGRLAGLEPGRELCELSAGGWRAVVFTDEAQYPAVHPQHERRKFLARAPRADSADVVLRFAGLGRYGDGKLERAHALAQEGFAAGPLHLEHGFLTTEFLQGTPVRRAEVDAALLDTMARYLAHVRDAYPATSSASADLRPLIEANVSEGVGARAGPGLTARVAARRATEEPPTALDARMLPHEWLRTGHGYIKVDALDHHDDHFYPGPQDIAWDVAGTCLEFGLSADARTWFVERYRRTSGDRSIASRLPFHALAYLAFRLGYATLAAETLGGTADGARFGAEVARYRGLLEAELADERGIQWHA